MRGVWKGRKHRHQWRRQHPPLWGADLPDRGYFDCATCPERRVSEPDSYSYVGWPWVQDGTLPPATWLDASTGVAVPKKYCDILNPYRNSEETA